MKQDIDMNHIINAFKNLPRRGQHNFVKILCLALGLAISSVIIAEIYFEQTYDTYFPGWERTYQIQKWERCRETMAISLSISPKPQELQLRASNSMLHLWRLLHDLFLLEISNVIWKTKMQSLVK